MKKLIGLVVGLAVVGGAVYGYYEMRPERRACAKLVSLCESADKGDSGKKDRKECEDTFAELKTTSGPEAVEKPAQCILDSKSCPEATGCFVGGVGGGLLRGAASEFFKGLGKSVGN